MKIIRVCSPEMKLKAIRRKFRTVYCHSVSASVDKWEKASSQRHHASADKKDYWMLETKLSMAKRSSG